MVKVDNDLGFRRIRKVHCGVDECLMSYSAEEAFNDGNIRLPEEYEDVKVNFEFPNNSVKIHESVKLTDVGIYIRGFNNVIIIEEGCELESCYLVLKGDGNNIKIGKNCKFIGSFWGDCVIHSKNGHTVSFGEGCLVSGDVSVRNSDGHTISEGGKIVNTCTDISIGNHVWIGYKVCLLKGANIGSNCIVGTGSVVTKSFGGNSVICGNPARRVKELKGTWIR